MLPTTTKRATASSLGRSGAVSLIEILGDICFEPRRDELRRRQALSALHASYSAYQATAIPRSMGVSQALKPWSTRSPRAGRSNNAVLSGITLVLQNRNGRTPVLPCEVSRPTSQPATINYQVDLSSSVRRPHRVLSDLPRPARMLASSLIAAGSRAHLRRQCDMAIIPTAVPCGIRRHRRRHPFACSCSWRYLGGLNTATGSR